MKRRYLHPTGKVNDDPSGAIGHVFMREQRFNLRRVYVSKTWEVHLFDGRRFTGFGTRKEAIAAALR